MTIKDFSTVTKDVHQKVLDVIEEVKQSFEIDEVTVYNLFESVGDTFLTTFEFQYNVKKVSVKVTAYPIDFKQI